MWEKRDEYFEGEEYLLGDKGVCLVVCATLLQLTCLKGFPISPYLIRTFSDRSCNANPLRFVFNLNHASARVVVEQAFGSLKNRFPTLKLMNGRDLSFMFSEICALVILHNWLKQLGDVPPNSDTVPLDDLTMDNDQVSVERSSPDGNPHAVRNSATETAGSLRRDGTAYRDFIMHENFRSKLWK